MPLSLEVFDALPDPVLILEGDVTLWANRRFAVALGRPRDELVGLSLSELLSEPDAALLRGARERSLEEGAALFHVAFEGTDERVWLDVRVSEHEEGRWLVSARDPSELAGVGEVMGRLSQLYVAGGSHSLVDLEDLLDAARPIFEGLGWDVGVYELDDVGLQLRSLVLPAEISAQRREQAGRLVGAVIPWEKAPLFRALMDSSSVGGFLDDFSDVVLELGQALGVPGAFLERVEHSFATRNLHRTLWAPAIIDGRPRFAVFAMGPELMERHLAAIQLYASQISATTQLARVSRGLIRERRQEALGQMAALLAHEVRNPLTVMLQAQRQIRRKIDTDDPLTLQLMDILDEETHRINRLMADLVKFSGPIPTQIQTLTVESVIEAAMTSVRESPEFKEGIEMVAAVPAGLPDVAADPMLLQDALRHLISNACAHVARGGHVEVKAGVDEGGVQLSVVNDGPSLGEDIASRVFEPFFTTKATGSGLGLAVVRKSIEEQGGRVALDATEAGVSFSVWIPAA